MYRARGALFRTIETVVEEKPLSFATSRIVTINSVPWREFPPHPAGKGSSS
jgi:hypothetical protein